MKNMWRRGMAALLAVVLTIVMGITADAAEDTQQVFETAALLAGSAQESGTEYSGFIFKLKDDVMMTMDADSMEGIDQIEYAENMFTAQTLEQIEETIPADAIDYIEPDYTVYLYDDLSSATEPNDKHYSKYQWNLGAMNVQTVWSYGIEGEDNDVTVDMDGDGSFDDDRIIIAVIDSGLKVGHEDIDFTRVLQGKNFVSAASGSTDDTVGHGTFCTGQIMAVKDNGLGIAGIAQNVYVMPLKVFDSNSESSSVVNNAINYAAEQRELFNADHSQGTNISVINMSLGGETGSRAQQSAVERAIDAGIIVICAAGNDGDTTASYPAQYAIGVGATNSDGEPADFSQRLSRGNGAGYANKVWVSAPGEDIVSLGSDSTNYYVKASGTSFASPEVAVLAALCKSMDNTLDHEGFKQLLKDTAVFTESGEGIISGQDIAYGWGQVDFAAAIEKLMGNLTGESVVTVDVRTESGEPVPNAVCTIYEMDDAEQAGAAIPPEEDGSFRLLCGHRYIYEVSADKYETRRGSFAVLLKDRTVTVELLGQACNTRFAVYNTRGEVIETPVITVNRVNGAYINQNQDGSFNTRKGDYTYSVTAQGYFEANGSFTVGEITQELFENGIDIQVTLDGDIDVLTLRPEIYDADGTDITSDSSFSVSGETGEPVQQYDGVCKLYPGTYTYSVNRSGYNSVTGSFTVRESQRGTENTLKIYMMKAATEYYVYIDILPLSANAKVTVTDGNGQRQKPLLSYSSPTYRLVNGTYKYTVRSDGYITRTGTFTVDGGMMSIELELNEGAGTQDDDTSGDSFITINGYCYSISHFKSLSSEAVYSIGGVQTQLEGVTLRNLTEYFGFDGQTHAMVTAVTEDGQTSVIAPDRLDSTMLALRIGDEQTLALAEDGAEAALLSPKSLTISCHEHTEAEEYGILPSCTEDGSVNYICIECGAVRTAAVQALGHDRDEDGICRRCGDDINRLTILTQPDNATVSKGSNAVFSVSATGRSLTYRWQYSKTGAKWYNVGSTIKSAKTAALSFTALDKYDGYRYRCVITDAKGESVTSDEARLTVSEELAVTAHPENMTVLKGDTVSFTVSASGVKLKYQWQYSKTGAKWYNVGSTIKSAKTASLSFTALEKYNGYHYRCVITDSKGDSVTSDEARLTVNLQGGGA